MTYMPGLLVVVVVTVITGSLAQQDCSSNLPHPRIVVIGARGVGKSTFSNYIAGNNETSPCYFKVQNRRDRIRVAGVTTETTAMKAKWMGKGKDFTIIDTPGLSDPQGNIKDKEYMQNILSVLRDSVQEVSFFIFCFKNDNTLRNDILRNLRIYHAMFGEEFFDRLVIEITFWPQSEYAINYRYNEEQTDYAMEIKQHFQNWLNITIELPVVFVDAMYDTYKEPSLTRYQKDALEALERFLFSEKQPFSCTQNCNDVMDLYLGGGTEPYIPKRDIVIENIGYLQISCYKWNKDFTSPITSVQWFANGNRLPNSTISKQYPPKRPSGVFDLHTLDLIVKGDTGVKSTNNVTVKCRVDSQDSKEEVIKIKFSRPAISSSVDSNFVLSLVCKQNASDMIFEEDFLVLWHNGKKVTSSNFDITVTTQEGVLMATGISSGQTYKGQYWCTSDYGRSKKLEIVIPRDGDWSNWRPMGSCSSSCGNEGLQHFTRECNNPSPIEPGIICNGHKEYFKTCNRVCCPVDILSQPAFWSDSKCENGTLVRTRKERLHVCKKKKKKNCRCQDIQHVGPCAVDGQWGSWSPFTNCTEACGQNGVQTRTRLCNNPLPSLTPKGKTCPSPASNIENKFCNRLLCKDGIDNVNTSIIPNFPEFENSYLPCAEENIKFKNEDIAFSELDTWENCGRFCQEILMCTAWTFHLEEKKCFLKKGNSLREYSPGYISGFKLCPKYDLLGTYSIPSREIPVDDAEDVYITENNVDLNKIFEKIHPRTRKLVILTDTLVLYKSKDVHQLDELSITARQIIISSVLETVLTFHSRTNEGVKVEIISDRTFVASTLKMKVIGKKGEDGVKGKDGRTGRNGVNIASSSNAQYSWVSLADSFNAQYSYVSLCRKIAKNPETRGNDGEVGGKGSDGGYSGYISYNSRVIDGSILVEQKVGQGGKGGEGGEGGEAGRPDFCIKHHLFFYTSTNFGPKESSGAKGGTGLNGFPGRRSISPSIKSIYSKELETIHGRWKLQDKFRIGHKYLLIKNTDSFNFLKKLNDLTNSARQLQTKTTIHDLGHIQRNIASGKRQVVEKYIVAFQRKIENLELRKQSLINVIPQQIDSAVFSKEASLEKKLWKERQLMIGNIMNALFGGIGGVTGLVSGVASAKAQVSKTVKITSGIHSGSTGLISIGTTYASTVEYIQGAKRQTSTIGCKNTFLQDINEFLDKYKHDTETEYSGKRQEFNSKFMSFLAGKAQRDLKLLLHCVLATNSWYQFETDPEAVKLSNTIDEYFDASRAQMEIYGEIISLQEEQHILSYEENAFSKFNPKLWRPLAYIKIEKQFVDILTGLIEAYEFKYLASFPDFENEIKKILSNSPVLDSRLDEWGELSSKIENWKSDKEESIQSNFIAWQEDIVHFRIIDEFLLNQLSFDHAFFTLPIDQDKFNGNTVKGVANNALNVRVYSLFVHLELGNTTDLPETIYLKVTHDGDSEFRSYEQKIIRKRTKDTFSMINKFEVDEKNMEEKAEEEMKKNRFCAQDDVITDTLTTCPGLFANYTISVLRGSHDCPEVKAGANCQSMNLEGSIQAINVFAMIKYQTKK